MTGPDIDSPYKPDATLLQVDAPVAMSIAGARALVARGPDLLRKRVRRTNRPLTLAGLSVFAVLTAAWVKFSGVPLSREWIALWLVVGLLAISLSDIRAWATGMLVDWMPLFVVLFTYDLCRGFADELMPYAHVFPQMRIDEWLFGGHVPTVWLQERFYHQGDPHWWDFAAWGIYTSHFFLGLVIAAVLWRFAYHRFRRYTYMFVGLTLAGYATYVLLPAVPPWLASQQGALEPTTRMIGQMWQYLGVGVAASIFSGGSEYSNDVAALPSLHAAYPVLFLLMFWNLWKPLRVLLVAYPLAMAVTLVYASEHYFSDILMGWVYAVATYVVGMAIERWWVARRARRTVLAVPLSTPGTIDAPVGTEAAVVAADSRVRGEKLATNSPR